VIEPEQHLVYAIPAHAPGQPPYPYHKAVKIPYLDGTLIEIDTGLEKLIRYMWANNIGTRYCCQGHNLPGYVTPAYIMFDGGNSASNFVSLICGKLDKEAALIEHINGGGFDSDAWGWSPAWFEGQTRWTVRFPRHHILELEEVLGL
jgi:hypothetical protein